MIGLRRRRTQSAVPAAFRGDKLKAKSRKLIDAYYLAQANGAKIAFSAAEWKSAKTALKKDTGGKCAYCEAPTDVVAHGDVEHFRPKSAYWWLAYCFDNYLYSCQICNQTYKGDKFPIAGALAPSIAMPGQLPAGAALDHLIESLSLDGSVLEDDHFVQLWQGEDADLPNPYFEDPGQYFVYEVDDGNEEVWIRSAGSARADRAIAAAETYLGLNRETLRRERYVNYRPLAVFNQVIQATANAAARQIATTEIRKMQRHSEPFAGMRRWFAAEWGLPGPN
jgi:hypothetical protein